MIPERAEWLRKVALDPKVLVVDIMASEMRGSGCERKRKWKCMSE